MTDQPTPIDWDQAAIVRRQNAEAKQGTAATAPAAPRTPAAPRGPHLGRFVLAAGAAITAGVLTYWLADGVLQNFATCTLVTGSMVVAHQACTNPGNAPAALGIFAALAGLWFASTGRLARLFCKV